MVGGVGGESGWAVVVVERGVKRGGVKSSEKGVRVSWEGAKWTGKWE